MTPKSIATFAFFLGALCVLPCCCAQYPETLYVNGNILTGVHLSDPDPDPTPARVAALAIRRGRIAAVGRNADVLALKGPNTVVIDLNGAFAMPGFNDAHTHMAGAGLQRLSVNLDNVPSLAAMQQKIKAYAATLAPGEWIHGGGWDHTKWATRKLPTRADIDADTGGHPALLERTDGHIAIVNTAALTAAGITDATPDPAGGKFDREAAAPHHATGIVREGPALKLIEAHIPPTSIETRRRALQLSIDDALAHGVTSVQDFSDWEDWLVLEELEHTKKLPLRVSEWLDFNLPVEVLKTRRASHDANDPLLHLGMLKGFMDGSLGSRTAALNAPYADDSGNSGIPRYEQQKLNQMAAERAAAGFQLGFHAIGDLGNDMALNALAAAEQVGIPSSALQRPEHPDAAVVTTPAPKTDVQDLRFRIEHAQVLSPDAAKRFADLGVIASMQPSHLLTDMAWAEARLGPERANRAYAWHTLLKHGVTLAFGTDYPVESISPFRGLYAAVTRQNEAGTATFQPDHAPDEVLTIQQAIYAYTQGSAFAEFRERSKGRLEPGYLADIVVLDRDITHVSPQDLLHTQVLRTIVGGETRYLAP